MKNTEGPFVGHVMCQPSLSRELHHDFFVRISFIDSSISFPRKADVKLIVIKLNKTRIYENTREIHLFYIDLSSHDHPDW